MQHSYLTMAANANWRASNVLTTKAIPRRLQELVTTDGSLTQGLIALGGGDFKVKVLKQEVQLPYFHEQRLLARPLQLVAMLREVELIIGNTPVVYARSIIPLRLLTKGNSGLVSLGQKPLGHLLFKQGKMRVSKRQFSSLDVDGITLCARRTPYRYMGSTILVSEFFLPTINDFIKK